MSAVHPLRCWQNGRAVVSLAYNWLFVRSSNRGAASTMANRSQETGVR